MKRTFAEVKIVKGDKIFEAFRAYVEEVAPPGVTTTVQYLGGGLPSLTPMDHPATQAAPRAMMISTNMEETMDAVTPKDSKAGVEGHSHIVRPAEME